MGIGVDVELGVVVVVVFGVRLVLSPCLFSFISSVFRFPMTVGVVLGVPFSLLLPASESMAPCMGSVVLVGVGVWVSMLLLLSLLSFPPLCPLKLLAPCLGSTASTSLPPSSSYNTVDWCGWCSRSGRTGPIFLVLLRLLSWCGRSLVRCI